MTRAGLQVVGQGIATVLALAALLLIGAVVVIGDTVAIAGCAICDDTPPNYPAAGVLTTASLAIAIVVVRAWRAACTRGGYR